MPKGPLHGPPCQIQGADDASLGCQPMDIAGVVDEDREGVQQQGLVLRLIPTGCLQQLGSGNL